MKRRTRQILSQSYFDRNRLAAHHLRSFNQFLDDRLQQVVDQKGRIETNIGNQSADRSNANTGNDSTEEPLSVQLGEIRVKTPEREEADGTKRSIYPQEARLRDLTYAAPLYLTIQIITGGNQEPETVFKESEVKVGELPIVVRSTACNLNGLPEDERLQSGEDPIDPGGYFIVNGNERVLMTTEDLVSNRILTEYRTRYGTELEVAKTFSEHEGYRALTTVIRGRDGLLTVSFPGTPSGLDFSTVVRALGMETDDEIARTFSDRKNIVKFVLEQLEDVEVNNRDDAFDRIGAQIARSHDAEYRRNQAKDVLDQHLLPHLNDDLKQVSDQRYSKAVYLCRMAEACFELKLDWREPDDKDHYKNTRLKLAGELMKDQFRAALNRFGRDIKYYVERAHMRNRRLAISNMVRPELISKRLKNSLSTGNWVGGRSGVSQFLDQTNQISRLSHLRRVQSPLSRAQPHFEARDLHATHWGRICPSETPEGENCGLVKNLAQGVEVSVEGDDREQLIDDLIAVGLKRPSEY
ncbi:DNA-directed RNA polymerase subunit B'' [Natrialbaceae archaeon A-CW3]